MLKFKLEKFEGPLSLLLKMIEGEEMDITEISLAKIADQYVEYIRNSNQINPEEMADFLVVAARLLLIKSKALLPFLYPEEEEEIEELEQQLRMYKEFVEAAKKVQGMIGRKKFMFAREFNRKVLLNSTQLFSPPKDLRKENLTSLFNDLLIRLEPAEELEEETLDHKVNIEDKIMSIQNMLLNRIKVSFNQVLDNTSSKTEVIVCFLAMLELIKQHSIVVNQEGLFNEITIEKQE
jgi:segregation and condensation protein A